MALPSSCRTSSGNERIAALAAGWKIAAFTGLMSNIRDIRSRQKRALRTARSRKSVQIAWNLLAGGAYHLAGGGAWIATDAGTHSPLAGRSVSNAGSRLFPAE